MKYKAVPGDWFVDSSKEEFTIATTAGILLGRLYAAVDYPCLNEGVDTDIDGEMLQVARLMAAAPDLRDALNALLRHVPVTDATLGKIKRAQAALYKAKHGGSPE